MRRAQPLSFSAIAVLTTLSIGCTGIIETPRGRPTGSSSTPRTIEEDLAACQDAVRTVGDTPLRRLTREEIRNAASTLLGHPLPTELADRLLLIPNGREGGFNSTTSSVDAEVARTYITLADDLAADIVGNLGAWVECDIEERACIETLVQRFGRRAYRRPLLGEETDELLDMYDETAAEYGSGEARHTVVMSILASPDFLYHVERVDPDAVDGELVRLDAYSIASRLSFFIWRGAPDDELLDAAAAGLLDTGDGVRAEAARMLVDPRGERTIESFHAQWLEIEDLEETGNPDDAWSPELGRAMHDEAMEFVRRVVFEEGGSLAVLLSASHTYGGAGVADIYGAEADADGRIELDPATRAGLLTMPAFLTRFGAIYPEVHRGRWIRGNLMCDPPGAPPPNLPDAEAPERLSTSPCVSCHVLMDPIGFGFDAYDSLGRFDADAPSPFEAPEVREGGGNLDPDFVGYFSGPRELADKLAASDMVEACVAVQWFRYAVGRAETEEDRCSVVTLTDAFIESEGNIQELILSIATSDSFLSRAVGE